jgi:hypothetical protein
MFQVVKQFPAAQKMIPVSKTIPDRAEQSPTARDDFAGDQRFSQRIKPFDVVSKNAAGAERIWDGARGFLTGQ